MIRLHTSAQPPSDWPAIPDIYFSREYGAACLENGQTWLLLEGFDGQWQMPLIVRPLDGGRQDAASPSGYSGIFADPGLSNRDLTAAWTSSVTALRELGLVSILLRHSPLVSQPPLSPLQISVVTDHPTRLVELGAVSKMWSQLEGRCRTAVRRAHREGLYAEVRFAQAEDAHSGSAFRVLYELTMQRHGASQTYRPQDCYYDRLVQGLGEDLWVAEAKEADGLIVASALLMRHNGTLHYHLSGSNPDGARRGANNLLLWHVMDSGARNGITRFHLGGGLKAGDSLQKFKESFGGRQLHYSVSGIILDSRSYREQTRHRARELGLAPAALNASRYFPAYRKGE